MGKNFFFLIRSLTERRISDHGVEAAGFHDLGELRVPIEDVDAVAFFFVEEEHFRLLIKIGADE